MCARSFLGRLFALIVPLAVCAPAQIPPGYEVVQVTNDAARERFARINNRSQIVYESWLDGTPQSSELFLWESGKATRLTSDNVRDSEADINDDGVIVWSRSRYIGPTGEFGPTAELMMRFPDGTVVQLTDNDTDDIGTSLNQHSHVALTRLMGSGCRGAVMDVFLFDGSEIRPITTNGVPEGLANQSPALNDNGQIVWTEFDFCLEPWDSDIMLWENGKTTRLTTAQFAPASPDINNKGMVAWFHRLPGTHAIDAWAAGITTRFTDWGTGPHLNDTGMVSFDRWHSSTETWQVWLYRDAAFWQLSDDPFWNFDGSINAGGEIAWTSGPSATRDVRYLRRFSTGDLNCDDLIDAFDIEPFVMALVDPAGYRLSFPSCDALLGDLNEDGVVDSFDIEPFINILVP